MGLHARRLGKLASNWSEARECGGLRTHAYGINNAERDKTLGRCCFAGLAGGMKDVLHALRFYCRCL